MFENLSERLERSFKLLKGQGKITEINVAETLKDVRRALLDADVNYKVAKQFTDTVKAKALGQNVINAIKPSELMVKIVHDELTQLMGGANARLTWSSSPLTVYMLCGLQGAGKTTMSAKLANWLKKDGKKPLLVACDIYRPAAIKQLQVVGGQVGVPVFERAQAWGVIMQAFQNAVCVSGTHGKTTTTSMVSHILMEAGVDPTIMIGGNLPLLNAGHRVGKGDTIVLESCEYCDSFLNFFPTIAVILNVEADHLDYFKDLADVEKSFRQFAELASDKVLANGDDPHIVETLAGMDYVTFGLQPGNRITAANVRSWREFDVICDGKPYCHLELKVFGKHNTMNALAAAGTAYLMGIPGEFVQRGLATFGGAERRMEFKGKFNGADVYDDYAHHPDELAATIAAVKSMGYNRMVIAFQPHTYTRTKALFADFVRELKLVDVVVLAEIYAAREQNTVGISSRDLAAEIPGAVYCETLPAVTDTLAQIATQGDVVLTVGAGDIYKAGEALLKI